MGTSGTGHTRRQLLGAGLAVTTLAGCGIFGDKPAPAAAPDPLQPVLDEALALAAAYDRAVAARPALGAKLTPLAADHRTHAADLVELIGATPSMPATPALESAAADPVAALRTAELAAQRTAVAACLAASADRAGMVASIAACRATHAEALR